MKRLKNLLLPLLTLLVVVGAAFVPQQLSLLRDARMSGEVHTEPLTGGNNFSVWTPTLEERIDLLARQNEEDDSVFSISQTLRGDVLAQAEQQALEQIEGMIRCGVLPQEALPDQLSFSYGIRLSIWTLDNLGGAAFLTLTLEHTGSSWYMYAILDEESGKILYLDLFWPPLGKYEDWPGEIGVQFLDYLGLTYSFYGGSEEEAIFYLPEIGELYIVAKGVHSLAIMPQQPSDGERELYLPSPPKPANGPLQRKTTPASLQGRTETGVG